MENLKNGSDVLFILLGAVMVLAMHSGFAFLELGTVRRKPRSHTFSSATRLPMV
jgi:ammonium transporter, Amt family